MSAAAPRLEAHASEATRLLFETHRRRIFAFCLNQLGNRCDAEDAVQTTFLYAFGCLERGVEPQQELAWLYKIAHNVCRTRRRSLGRRRRVEAPVDFDACEYAVAAPERSDDELVGLSGALAAMPSNQRKALLLREWQGLTYAEIADRLALTQSAVETLLFRARRSLASQLSRVPQKVAVLVNVPVLIRLLRRLAPNAGALKTTAAVVAVGAVSTVGGRALERAVATPSPSRASLSQLAASPSTASPSTELLHRLGSMTPVSPRRSSLPHRIEAPSAAEAAALKPAAPGETPAAASAQSSPPNVAAPVAAASSASPRAASISAAAPAQIPQVSPAKPVLPVGPPASPGELAGSAVAAAQSVVQQVAPIVEAPVETAQQLVGDASAAANSAVQTLEPAVQAPVQAANTVVGNAAAAVTSVVQTAVPATSQPAGVLDPKTLLP